MLDHEVGCRSHNTGCDGDCDCRAFAELDTAKIRVPDRDAAPNREDDVSDRLFDVEKAHVLRVLADCNGNRSEAARRLGIYRSSLQRKLKKYEGTRFNGAARKVSRRNDRSMKAKTSTAFPTTKRGRLTTGHEQLRMLDMH